VSINSGDFAQNSAFKISMAVSGVACKKALVGTGAAISVLFGINGLACRNKPSYPVYPVGPPFLAFMADFSAMPNWHFPRALIESSLVGGCA